MNQIHGQRIGGAVLALLGVGSAYNSIAPGMLSSGFLVFCFFNLLPALPGMFFFVIGIMLICDMTD